jgi:hypothetical protein
MTATNGQEEGKEGEPEEWGTTPTLEWLFHDDRGGGAFLPLHHTAHLDCNFNKIDGWCYKVWN